MSSSSGSSVIMRRAAADVRPRAIQAFARKLQREVARGRAFDVLITGDAELRRLNRQFLGKDYATYYASVKREEWRQYHQTISPWEREQYLKTF